MRQPPPEGANISGMTETTGRRTLRLAGWDYTSARGYFVTICAYQRHLSFEERQVASVIEWAWNKIPAHFSAVSLDEFVVMPNHVHGIVVMERDARFVGARYTSPLRTRAAGTQSRSLGAIVGTFKGAVTRQLRRRELWGDEPLWQRNYHERIIRDDDDLARIREYIVKNPATWKYDSDNPARSRDEAHERSWGWIESVDAAGVR
jgi:REP element-mobilizing transposase RayT